MSELIQYLWGIPGGILTVITSIITFLYTRWQHARDSQFTTVNADTRIKILKQIRKLYQLIQNDTNSCHDLIHAEIKACYERVGLTFQNNVNRLIVNLYEEQGLSFRDVRGKYFLRSRSMMHVTPEQFHFSVRAARLSKWLFIIFPYLVALAICTAVYFLMRHENIDVHDRVFQIFSVIYMLEWFVIFYFSQKEYQKAKNGLAFWTLLEPYLQLNGIQTANIKHHEGNGLKGAIVTLLPVIKYWLGKLWKI